MNVTGCEKLCYCEMGNVSCQAACKPVPALPPATLPCSAHQAALTRLPANPCCLQWTCSLLPGKHMIGLNENKIFIFPDIPNSYS